MSIYKVTLKARLKRGTFYWVAEVRAETEEEAVVAAENLFLAEIETSHEWEFEEFDVEPA